MRAGGFGVKRLIKCVPGFLIFRGGFFFLLLLAGKKNRQMIMQQDSWRTEACYRLQVTQSTMETSIDFYCESHLSLVSQSGEKILITRDHVQNDLIPAEEERLCNQNA